MENIDMDSMRIDKWLWTARFFKTRTIAGRACELGRVLWNEQPAKPSRDIKVGDKLRVTNDGGVFQIEVKQLNASRVSAALAQVMYTESEESKQMRAQAASEHKAMFAFTGGNAGRPSKKDRRDINRVRGRY